MIDLAAGRFDGMWEEHIHLWNCIAGLLLVKEAGASAMTAALLLSCVLML